jgi:predicted DNA-binding transcriptional regulator AlpA
MSELLEQLETLIEAKVSQLAMSERLWSYDDIATYLGLTKSSVVNNISKLPNFPQAIRLDKKSNPRFEPKDVKKWALSHKEKRAA